MNRSEKKAIIDWKNKSLNEALDNEPKPAVILEYAKNTILQTDHRGWFERPKNRKETKVAIYCAACQTTYIDYKPTHNTYDRCTHCGSDILMRRIGASKHYRITKKDYICFFQKIGDAIIARFFDNCRYYTDEKFKLDLEKNLVEYQRVIFRKGSTKSFVKHYSWSAPESYWSIQNKIGPHVSNYHVFNSISELKELFIGTHLERTLWFDYLKFKGYVDEIISLYKFATWPVLEYLTKLGYMRLITEIIYGRTREDKTINLYEKKATLVLGVPHSILQKYDHANLRECDIKAIKQLIEYGRLGQLTPERMKFISSCLTNQSLDPLGIFKDFGIEKVINYINKQLELKNKTDFEIAQKHLEEFKGVSGCSQASYSQPHYNPKTAQTAWRDFQDYRRECHELGYDLTNEGVMFPRDLYSAHSRTSELVAEQRTMIRAKDYAEKNAKLIQGFANAIKKYLKRVFDDGTYVFRIAREPQELIMESMHLKHCVGTSGYDKRVADGKSLIFLVRSVSSPEKPLYTLELNAKTKKIVQLRGFSNHEAPPEIYSFVEDCLQQLNLKASA